MSFFKRMMASVGIGNIELDAQLDSEELIPGELVEGVISARGGSVQQKVDSIYFHLMTEFTRESDNRRITEQATVCSFLLSEGVTVAPGENVEIPFHFTLPDFVPISIGINPIWVKTGLEISGAVDPSDRDDVEILPHPHMAIILEALEHLNFELSQAKNEYNPKLGRNVPFIQEFEFKPKRNSKYRGTLDELEIVFFPDAEGIELVMEIDRKARGVAGLFADALELEESWQRVYFSCDHLEEGVPAVAEILEQILDEHV